MKIFTFACHAKVPGSIPLAKDFFVLGIHDEQGTVSEWLRSWF